MTPEELEAIQHFIGIRQYLGYLSNEQLYQHLNKYHQWLCNMSEHIDQQAASLDEAEALTRRNVELINGYMARITELGLAYTTLKKSFIELNVANKKRHQEISELEAQIIQQTGISASRMEEREGLRKQIAALQEIAISERERRHMSDMSLLGFVLDSNACPDPRKIAEDQLVKEHPEAFR